MSRLHRISPALTGGLSFALAVASFPAHATESAAPAAYRSVFEGYEAFDPQAVLVDWRKANAAIRDGATGEMHETHSSEAKLKGETPTSTHDHNKAAKTHPHDSTPSSEATPPDPPKDPHEGHQE